MFFHRKFIFPENHLINFPLIENKHPYLCRTKGCWKNNLILYGRQKFFFELVSIKREIGFKMWIFIIESLRIHSGNLLWRVWSLSKRTFEETFDLGSNLHLQTFWKIKDLLDSTKIRKIVKNFKFWCKHLKFLRKCSSQTLWNNVRAVYHIFI